METFVRMLQNDPAVARAALMIDSSHWETLLKGLKNAQGKCIVNSISLKDGEQAFLDKAAEIHRLGAAMVVMAFDEQGQATTYPRKIEICQRAYRLLTGIGIPPHESRRTSTPGRTWALRDTAASRKASIQGIHLGSQGGSHRRHPPQGVPGNLFRRHGGILGPFHQRPGTLLFKKSAGLVDGHGMGTHLADVLQPLTGEGQQVLVDVQVHLSDDPLGMAAEQVKIRQKPAGGGIFNRHHGRIGPMVLHCLIQTFE
jgi:hypothetical protein